MSRFKDAVEETEKSLGAPPALPKPRPRPTVASEVGARAGLTKDVETITDGARAQRATAEEGQGAPDRAAPRPKPKAKTSRKGTRAKPTATPATAKAAPVARPKPRRSLPKLPDGPLDWLSGRENRHRIQASLDETTNALVVSLQEEYGASRVEIFRLMAEVYKKAGGASILD